MSDPRPVIPYASPSAHPPPLPTAPAPTAFTPEQLRDLAAARQRFKLLRRAIRVAMTDGITLAFCALLTLAGAAFGMGGLLIGLALAALAAFELYAAAKLKTLHPQAPTWLALNQLALGAALLLYALYNLAFPAPLPSELTANARDLKEAGIDLTDLYNQIRTVLYGSLIAIAILVQGSMAWFYHRRSKMLTAHLTQTPDWIRQLQSTGVEL